MSVAENAAGFSAVGLILIFIQSFLVLFLFEGRKLKRHLSWWWWRSFTILSCVAWLFIQAVDQPLRLPEFHQPASLKRVFFFLFCFENQEKHEQKKVTVQYISHVTGLQRFLHMVPGPRRRPKCAVIVFDHPELRHSGRGSRRGRHFLFVPSYKPSGVASQA